MLHNKLSHEFFKNALVALFFEEILLLIYSDKNPNRIFEQIKVNFCQEVPIVILMSIGPGYMLPLLLIFNHYGI